jgi:hypothetical protein
MAAASIAKKFEIFHRVKALQCFDKGRLAKCLPYGVICLVWALFVIRYWVFADGFIDSSSDDTWHIPWALKLVDPELYPRDFFLNEAFRIFPKPIFYLLAWAIYLFKDIRFTTLFISSSLLLVFLITSYIFIYQTTKARWISLLISLLFIRPRNAFGGAGWGIYLGSVEPRAFCIAITPLLLWYFSRHFNDRKKLFLLFSVMGILTNLHPLSALHLALLLCLALIWLNPWGTTLVINTLVVATGFSLGAFWYIMQYINFQASLPSVEIINYRFAYLTLPAFSNFIAFGFNNFAIPLSFAIAGLLSGAYSNQDNTLSVVKKCFLISILLALSTVVSKIYPKYMIYQVMRISGTIYLFAFTLGSLFLIGLKKKETLGSYATIFFIFLILFIFTDFRSNFYRLQKIIRGEISSQLVISKQNIYQAPHKDAFMDLCQWVVAHTSKNSLFLVPPDGFNTFRIYSKRGIIVSYKDGGAAIYNKAYAATWYQMYQQVKQLYHTKNVDHLLNFAKKNKVNFLVDDRSDQIWELPIAYQNEYYIVYLTFKQTALRS